MKEPETLASGIEGGGGIKLGILASLYPAQQEYHNLSLLM